MTAHQNPGKTDPQELKGFSCHMKDPKCQELVDIDLQELAELHDSDRSFLSLYLNFNEMGIRNILADRFIKSRVQAINRALKGETALRGELDRSLSHVSRLLRFPAFSSRKDDTMVQGAVFFVDMDDEIVYCFFLPAGVTRLMVVDSSPYIKPLAVLMEEWKDVLLVFVDTNNAAVYHVGFATAETEKSFKKDIFHHHKKGGWSQMRYQRIRDGALKQFYKEIAEVVEKSLREDPIEMIFVAGPGDAKNNFADELSKAARDKLVSFMETDNDPQMEELWQLSLPLFMKAEEREERELVEELRGLIMKDGLATYGLNEVIQATTSGRAEMILMAPDQRIPGFKCEECGTLKQHEKRCSLCGKGMLGVDLSEELVELAQLMGTKIEFIKKAELLEELGGIAAFLRF